MAEKFKTPLQNTVEVIPKNKTKDTKTGDKQETVLKKKDEVLIKEKTVEKSK